MNAVRELVKRMCPDGVQYKALWEVTTWDKRFQRVERKKQPSINPHKYLLAKELDAIEDPSGNVKLLTTSPTSRFTTEQAAGEYLKEGEIVCIPWGGNANIQYYKGRYVTSDNRIATSNDSDVLLNRYLYHCMMQVHPLIESYYRGSGLKHPDMAKVLDLRIPVPPIEIQEEIVRVLDSFTELEGKLGDELEARRQQYVYYRDALLDYSANASVEWAKLSDLYTQFISPIRDRPKVFDGDIPWCRIEDVEGRYMSDSTEGLRVSQRVVQEMNLKVYPIGTVLVACSASIGTCVITTQPLVSNQRFVGLVCGEKIRNTFLRYYIESQTKKLASISSTGTIAGITRKRLDALEVPVPPLEEQDRVVNILDKFSALTTDATQGLPAEIEARRMQYAYYRDKLLTFKEKTA